MPRARFRRNHGVRVRARRIAATPALGIGCGAIREKVGRLAGTAAPSAFALLFLLLSLPLGAQEPVPSLDQRATDLTGTLSAAELESLNTRLAALEESTGSQVAVLMVPTTQPETVEAYALRVAEAWQLGREGVDDGVLLLIAKNDRQLRVEVGYGLEGAIPDARANRIIDERMVPRFYAEDYAGGIDAGLDAIEALIQGEPLPPPEGAGPGVTSDGWGLVPFLAIAAAFLAPIFRRIFGSVFGPAALGAVAGGIAWLMVSAMFVAIVVGFIVFVVALGGTGGPGFWASGRRGWGGGLGGRGGLGGGGFRGGGGGFGGGGASGRW